MKNVNTVSGEREVNEDTRFGNARNDVNSSLTSYLSVTVGMHSKQHTRIVCV